MKLLTPSPLFQRVTLAVMLGVLVILVYVILEPFFNSIAWAALVAYISWPVHERLQRKLSGWPNLSALLMVIALAVAFVFPLLWLVSLVQRDLINLYRTGLADLRLSDVGLPEFIGRIPVLGSLLQEWLTQHLAAPEHLKQDVMQWLQGAASHVAAILGNAGRNAAKFVLALVSLFFFYRDGETLARQTLTALQYLAGTRADNYLRAAGTMCKVIFQSAILSALLQGLVAGLGYWIIGMATPALLGAATAMASFLPVLGTTFIWGSVSLSFFFNGDIWHGMAMLAWGMLLVHPVDNIIRPLMISNAARIPFLLTLFGAFGASWHLV